MTMRDNIRNLINNTVSPYERLYENIPGEKRLTLISNYISWHAVAQPLHTLSHPHDYSTRILYAVENYIHIDSYTFYKPDHKTILKVLKQ